MLPCKRRTEKKNDLNSIFHCNLTMFVLGNYICEKNVRKNFINSIIISEYFEVPSVIKRHLAHGFYLLIESYK